jgi:hypothetical protein
MKTAGENYRAELQKFKEKINNALREIDTLVFVLEYGSYEKKPTVKHVLKKYGNIPDDIRNAFDELNKSKGDKYIHRLKDPTTFFVKKCALSWEYKLTK